MNYFLRDIPLLHCIWCLLLSLKSCHKLSCLKQHTFAISQLCGLKASLESLVKIKVSAGLHSFLEAQGRVPSLLFPSF